MRYSFFNSLKLKIALLFTLLIAVAFGLNLYIAIDTLKAEKIKDLQKVLSHATWESMDEYLPKDADDKLDISYLYKVPHNISIIDDSEADSIRFFITKSPYVPLENEIAEYVKLQSGYYLNCVSTDSKVNYSILRYTEKLLAKYLLFLLVVLAASVYCVHRLMKPLSALVVRCKEYRDGVQFDIQKDGCPSEICAVADAFSALIRRLENYRKREKELFKEAAHELKTPLALMRARLDVYEDDDGYPKDKFAKELGSDIERLSSELRSVLFFETSDFEESMEFEICDLTSEVVSKMEILSRRRQITIEARCEKTHIHTKKRLFQKLLGALLENAMTYAKEGSSIRIELDAKERKLCIKNEKGGEKYMFSSKIGERILKRVSLELGLEYELIEKDDIYEVCLRF